ncbi:MAG: DUF1566 domain-containing protein [Nitrospinaceae bacterium]|nr:DUF1566 domain-containing protein [Nitrospinaceae bacterium]NIR53731.1 DUF1566 domain-containing protein [Nitrospinaceae bacterium]NIS84139.1 DUF1566 domain-containing protein [Nitrospinaceae bacterium]NIT80940.1 DUF1566 domain-containing protein [Nitrospinaceae bacterium]NIU43238.1 DUF1566 domain-containing protein [Nitrospinaceae bacterium]
MGQAKVKSKFIDNGDGTVTDSRNNLMWAKSDTWVELGKLVTWWQAQDYVQELNNRKFAGHSNWRIPNGQEVRELFHPEFSNTDMEGCEIHLDPVFTPGCGYTSWTTETRGAKAAMGYDFREDYEFWLARENEGFPSGLRPVRSITQASQMDPEERYVDHRNGTVSDLQTGLMWKKDDSYLDLDKWVSWAEGKTYVKELNNEEFAGYTDWKMPTRKEAQTIHDPGHPVTDKYGDTLFLVPCLPAGAGQTTWTKTLHKTDNSLAIRFNFYSGDYKFHKKGLRSHGVRAVRHLTPEEMEHERNQ